MRYVFAILLMLGFIACGDPGRKPPPEVVVQILDEPGLYMVDGDRVFTADARARLQNVADKNRRPMTSTSRVLVRVYHSSSVRYGRVQDFLGWCGQMGLDKVTVQVRDLTTPVPKADQSLAPRNSAVRE
jgi:hypothetical protein